MKKYFFLLTIGLYAVVSNAQNVGIGTPNPQNKLHVAGGFRLDTLTGVNGAGLLKHDANGVVYGIKFSGNINDVLRGDGTFGSGGAGSVGWLLNGNSGTNPATHFIGTTDNASLVFKIRNLPSGQIDSALKNTSLGYRALSSTAEGSNTAFGYKTLANNYGGTNNVAMGSEALFNNYTGDHNVAIGVQALYTGIFPGANVAIGFEALKNNSAAGNTAIGTQALTSNTSGNLNAALGRGALFSNETGIGNTSLGAESMIFNTTGYENTAVGNYSLKANNGYFNSALGANSLLLNTTGHDNTALGYSAMRKNQASFNTSVGAFSMYNNNNGDQNTAVGYKAMELNTSGVNNTATGFGALQGNTGGGANSAYGHQALASNNSTGNSAFGSRAMELNTSGIFNSAIGYFALSNNLSGSGNTAVGVLAGYDLPNNVSNVTCIGYSTGWNTTSSNQVNIGNFSVTWIGGQTGWFHYSDKRIKNNIKDDVPGLAFITRLKPVTYNVNIDEQEKIARGGKKIDTEEFKHATQKNREGKYDVQKIKMTGFFAQDVEEAAKSINYSFSGVHNPRNGGLYSLDYSAFVVPLVKAVQEQQVIIEKQQKQIDDLIKRIEALEKK